MLSKIEDIKLDKYVIQDSSIGKKVLAITSGNVRKSTKIKVGDIVNVAHEGNDYIIQSIEPRHNDFIRPPVANIDYIYITVSVKSPKPDMLLLDKQLITARSKNVEPIILLNKIDLVDEKTEEQNIIKEIYEVYTKLGYKVIKVSSKANIGIDDIKDIEAFKTATFSGGSGVGKSSLMNNIVCEEIIDEIVVGDVSKKLERGKHTTKHVRLYETKNIKGEIIYLLDTPGFSSYEVFDVESSDIRVYYPEFSNVVCSYQDCNHINEDNLECKVKRCVQDGTIDKGRYERYIKIYEEVKKKEKSKYK